MKYAKALIPYQIQIITEKQFLELAKIEIKKEPSDTSTKDSSEPDLEFQPLFQ